MLIDSDPNATLIAASLEWLRVVVNFNWDVYSIDCASVKLILRYYPWIIMTLYECASPWVVFKHQVRHNLAPAKNKKNKLLFCLIKRLIQSYEIRDFEEEKE